MTAPATADGWLRLDPRMLVVTPVTEIVKYIPVLFGAVVVGSTSGNHLWGLVPAAAIVAYGVLRWFTTTYRVGESHVELRSGVLQRRTLSVPRTRIRSVDVEADLLHRLLGLAVLVIGTGQQAEKNEGFRLDALDARAVPPLRTALLAHTAAPAAPATASGAAPAPAAEVREIAHWRPAWVRYAPLSLTGLAVVAPIAGLGAQYGIIDVISDSAPVRHLGDDSAAIALLVVAGVALTAVALVSVAACLQYLATWFGLRVVDNGTTLHLTHGLFTTRQITLDMARFRGATIDEPLLLRLARAGQLEMIMTGENPRQKLVPQAPRTAVARTLDELLDTRRGPDAGGGPRGQRISGATLGTVDLVPHGPVARKRRYTKAAWPAAGAYLAVLVALLLGADPPPWIWSVPAAFTVIMAALAEDRYRGLGHRVLPGADGPAWLVTRRGSLDRSRDCLEARGVVGWTVKQTFWQRRSGVATVVAATAAGKKAYPVIDLPLDQAWALIEATTPGLPGRRD
ncbi:PH domain-containing protein [Nocardia thailandica]|uniref:PH domain-containing protein n=1 Tax=Nocardia thailandica TaxID=257275 RepID=A0ABW6PKD4_9NOCA